MGFFSQYPASSSGSNASVGTNGATAPSSSTEVAGINPSGNLQPLRTDASGNLLVAPATTIAPSHVIVDSSALPAGASTSALQTTGNTSLAAIQTSAASIDSKLTNPLPVSGPLTDTQLRATPVPVSGTVAVSNPGLTDTQLRAAPVPVSATSLPLPTGAATEATLSSFSAKSTSSDVHEAYDYRSFAYVGATQKIDTIVYKSGGSGGATVATQTFGYDGSDRLTSITKT